MRNWPQKVDTQSGSAVEWRLTVTRFGYPMEEERGVL